MQSESKTVEKEFRFEKDERDHKYNTLISALKKDELINFQTAFLRIWQLDYKFNSYTLITIPATWKNNLVKFFEKLTPLEAEKCKPFVLAFDKVMQHWELNYELWLESSKDIQIMEEQSFNVMKNFCLPLLKKTFETQVPESVVELWKVHILKFKPFYKYEN